MSENVSSEFEYSASFLNILIPGIFFTALISFLLISQYPYFISFFKASITESVWAVLPLGVIFATVAVFVGLIINVLVTPLTKFLEGYYLQYFGHFFMNMLQNGQLGKYNSYKNIYDHSEQQSILRALAYENIYYYFSHCLYESIKNPDIDEEEMKKYILPTTLGNVFKSIEIYPKWKYGMSSYFFWTRIQLLMSEENKKTIDKMRAFIDMFVELTWIFFFVAIIYSIFYVYNGNYIFSIVSLVIFILFSLASYYMAVQSALNFGFYVRSIFDIYREELWNRIKNKLFSEMDSISEKERWDKVFRYLWFYNTIQCQKCDRFYDATKEHICKISKKKGDSNF